jgi:hypothetical protein
MKTFNKFFEGISEIDVNYIKLDKEYVTTLDSNECYLANTPKNDDVEYECKNIVVYWGLVFNDESNIGLSRIEAYVKKITGIIEITTTDELGNIVGEPVEETIDFKYEKIDCTVDIDSEKEVSYFPKDLTIYYDKKVCEIEIGN